MLTVTPTDTALAVDLLRQGRSDEQAAELTGLTDLELLDLRASAASAPPVRKPSSTKAAPERPEPPPHD